MIVFSMSYIPNENYEHNEMSSVHWEVSLQCRLAPCKPVPDSRLIKGVFSDDPRILAKGVLKGQLRAKPAI